LDTKHISRTNSICINVPEVSASNIAFVGIFAEKIACVNAALVNSYRLVFENDVERREGGRRNETPKVEFVNVENISFENIAKLVKNRIFILKNN
jgi:hypothetical protein